MAPDAAVHGLMLPLPGWRVAALHARTTASRERVYVCQPVECALPAVLGSKSANKHEYIRTLVGMEGGGREVIVLLTEDRVAY